MKETKYPPTSAYLAKIIIEKWHSVNSSCLRALVHSVDAEVAVFFKLLILQIGSIAWKLAPSLGDKHQQHT